MAPATRLGLALGALLSGFAVVGNLLRGDPHLVSAFPSWVPIAIAPLAVFLLARHRRARGESAEAVRALGLRVGTVAGGLFALVLGAFTFYWLGAWQLWLASSSMAFITVFVLSACGAYAAGHRRLTAV